MLVALGKGTEAGSLDVPVKTAARVTSIEENKKHCEQWPQLCSDNKLFEHLLRVRTWRCRGNSNSILETCYERDMG